VVINSKEKVSGYGFDLALIQMLVCIKLKTSASFRSIGKMMVILAMYVNLLTKTPHHTTVAIWVRKIGYYELARPKPKSDDWILILDESIKIGTEKLLVILDQDLTPLRAISKSHWNSQLIANQLNDLKATLGTIVYAVGDYGSYIKKGLQSANIAHLYDITHKIALILKKIYGKDERFQTFTQEMVQMRTNCFQTVYAYLIPPRQRQKSRYQNIGIISGWGMKVLHYVQNHSTDQDLADKLLWVVEYEDFIRELDQLNQIICDIEKIIKHNGLSKSTVDKCQERLELLSNNQSGKIFKEELNAYFEACLKLTSETKTLLATSDILESAFGKYKNYLSDNPMAGITNLALSIPAFTASLEKTEIKKALMITSINDVKRWTEKNIGTSLLKKRREAFLKKDKNGKKKNLV
jgi:hypothetical protein